MNQTTKETRRRSYDAVLPKRAARCRLILETLGNRELTASEITEELVAAGRIPYFSRNYVAPRLTELKEIGILTTVGRRKATRSDATEAVWARAEPSGPTGQTAGSSPCRCAITSRSLRRTTGSSPPAPSVALSAGRQTRPAGSSHWSPTSEPPAQPAR